MENSHLFVFLSIQFLVISLKFGHPFADDDVVSFNNGTSTCSCADEKMIIARQELALRNLRDKLEKLTFTTETLSEIQSLILALRGDMKSAVLNTNQKVQVLFDEVDASALIMDTMQNDFMNTVERLEDKVANLTSENMGRNESDQCRTEDLSSKTLLESEHEMLDCSDIHRIYGERKSGPYRIYTSKSTSYTAYCDMETDGGGWTVIQRRMDGSVNFNRVWNDYKHGFGSVTGEHWLGNKAISELSSNCRYCELRIDLEDFNGNKRYARYLDFAVATEAEGYKLKVGRHYGDAGNSLSYHNGMKFTTKDVDQDNSKKGNCAVWREGGWWFNACLASNLNGIYLYAKTKYQWDGIIWRTWGQNKFPFKASTMMIRQESF